MPRKHWLILRPEMYEPKLQMMTDEELTDAHHLLMWGYELSREEILAHLKGVFVGDWIAIRDGIAIRLRDGLFGSEQVSA